MSSSAGQSVFRYQNVVQNDAQAPSAPTTFEIVPPEVSQTVVRRGRGAIIAGASLATGLILLVVVALFAANTPTESPSNSLKGKHNL